VPSKAVIRASRLAQEARRARSLLRYGPEEDARPDFAAAFARMRQVRARISHEDAAARYRDEFGVDVFLGEARFTGPDRLRVEESELRFRRAVIATGGRPARPPVPGLAEAGYLDNESVFTLTERPQRLAVIGAGPIGCELAQAFRRLGSEVYLLERADRILTREDPDAAGIVEASLRRDGVEIVAGCTVEQVERHGETRRLQLRCAGGEPRVLEVDRILVGAGRAPNVEGLGLDVAGVEADARDGVRVDDHLRTTNRRIWAAGDVCMRWKFTHAADAAAKIVVQNALFAVGPLGRRRLSDLVMPWCTYTDPEIAHVGLYAHEARRRGRETDTWQVPIARANRAVTDGEEEGLVKVVVERGRDRILGATVVASHAGELVTPLTLAIQKKIGLGAFSHVVMPYPTQTEALKAAAGAYTRSRLTPGVARALRALLRLRR
jgi:pyruvate/2-oxoglutarate dehydrogenase complex dihydrolipoamide dehydrogenase (E3) component